MMPEATDRMTGDIVLETERLTLRRMTPADAPFLRALLNEPSFLRFIGDRGVRTDDDARAYVADGPAASYAEHGFGLYLVTLREDGTPIGICGLLRRPTLDAADLGYAFLPAHRSRGYARESASAVVAYARRDLGLDRLLAITSPDNDASIRVLEALGFRFDRLTRLSEGAPEVKLFVLD
jgi:RimJ/RimL family protein N-acetyltransferase